MTVGLTVRKRIDASVTHPEDPSETYSKLSELRFAHRIAYSMVLVSQERDSELDRDFSEISLAGRQSCEPLAFEVELGLSRSAEVQESHLSLPMLR
jgi:hypothetical protein